LSESSSPNSVSFPSVASYKRETNIKLLNPWTNYRISIYYPDTTETINIFC
jgi:hypothetical protein